MSAHLDPETLAAYIDQRLPTSEREEIERHLAACADCRGMLSDATAFLDTEDAPLATTLPAATVRPRPVWQVWSIGLAAAAAVILAVWVGFRTWQTPTASPELRELVTAFAAEPTRPLEPRLTGGFSYAPAPPVTRGTSEPVANERSPEVRLAIAGLERAAEEQPAPRTRAALAVGQLIDGNVGAAISELERLTSDEPNEARFWSDLSAAYLADGTRRADRERVQQAVTAADRALQLDPALSEALFNRALALERLGDAAAARDAWTRVREKDGSSGWSTEAAEHLQRLSSR